MNQNVKVMWVQNVTVMWVQYVKVMRVQNVKVMDQKSQNIMGSKNVKLIWVQKCQFNMDDILCSFPTQCIVQIQTFGFNLITYNRWFQVDKHSPEKSEKSIMEKFKGLSLYLGTCFPDPVSAKKVLKESS